jgi:hypothetical protein
MMKIGFIQPKGLAAMVIYYDSNAKNNPYRVVSEWNELTTAGIRKRRRIIAKYADLASCGIQLYHYTMAHNEEGR